MPTLERPVQIGVDTDHIAGTFVVPGTLIPGVLFVHGWGGSQAQYLARARDVASLGCICLTFDLRGHAQTRQHFETVSRAHNLADILAAYDTLAGHPHVDPSAVAVVGSSYGGYLASILTTLRPVKWLALRAPALYHDTSWDAPKLQLHKEQDLPRYRGSLVAPADNRALAACQAFEGDVLLVESEQDTVVPRTVLTSFREAASRSHSLTYRSLPGADHGLSSEADQQAYSKVLTGWLKEMIGGARRAVTQPPGAPDPLAGGAEPERPPEVLEAQR